MKKWGSIRNPIFYPIFFSSLHFNLDRAARLIPPQPQSENCDRQPKKDRRPEQEFCQRLPCELGDEFRRDRCHQCRRNESEQDQFGVVIKEGIRIDAEGNNGVDHEVGETRYDANPEGKTVDQYEERCEYHCPEKDRKHETEQTIPCELT